MLEVNGWEISFVHYPEEIGQRRVYGVDGRVMPITPYRGRTVCTLHDGITGVLGYAYCSPTDQYSKDKGRKIALADALSVRNFFTKEIRRMIWFAYFQKQWEDKARAWDIPKEAWGVCYEVRLQSG